MRGFDVLDRTLPLPKRALIEASAGTGKTFTIVHLVLRLLLEKEGPTLDQILLVTFTKAATAELRERLHALLFKTATEGDVHERCVAERALALLDEAKIFTIHGFCLHMLKNHAVETGMPLDLAEEGIVAGASVPMVLDLLRKEADRLPLPQQLDLLLKAHGNTIEELAKALGTTASLGLPIEGGLEDHELQDAWQAFIADSKVCFGWHPDKLFEDLLALAPLFGKTCDRQRQVKEEFAHALESLTKREKMHPLLLLFAEENRGKRGNMPQLHYPGFLETLQKRALPLVEESFDEGRLFALLAEKVRLGLEAHKESEDLLFYDDLLKIMAERVKDSTFAENIKREVRAVCIDEFQDTDPLQWTIFNTLFLDEYDGHFYLVGDPKQSIYRFRNADLYTYLEAKEAFGEDLYALTTNYRAAPSLISALNELLTPVTDFFPLPQRGEHLKCPRIDTPPGSAEEVQKRLHFWPGEDEKGFLPRIVEEIRRLEIPPNACAVLVKDRYQADRVVSYLNSAGVPTTTLRSRSILDSPAFEVMIALLEAIEHPRDLARVGKLIGGPLFSLPYSTPAEDYVKRLDMLRELFEQEGIAALFRELYTDAELIKRLSLKEGRRLYADLRQFVELLALERGNLREMLALLLSWRHAESEAECFQVRSAEDGVSVLTIHMSKGLEFSVVFALGLILPTTVHGGLLVDRARGVLARSRKAEQSHREELDAEKMRQFYVAVTRAKEHLYLPYLTKNVARERGEASPMELFLTKFLRNTTLEALVSLHPEMEISYESVAHAHLLDHDTKILTPPRPLSFSYAPIFLRSFSSLSTAHPEPLAAPPKSGLPRGAFIGTTLHTLLESLSFEELFAAKASVEFLIPEIEKTALREWKEEVAALLHATFTMPLPAIDSPLIALDPGKMKKEMRFLYPEHDLYQGAIDLVFAHEGKYYILDWKSNDLPGYSGEALLQAMEQHDYFLQAEIYMKALRRYLILFGEEGALGGALYLFLRGPAAHFVEASYG